MGIIESTQEQIYSIHDELYYTLKLCLSRPPSRAGVSIRSEPVLAKLLGIKRPTVRKVIDRLVEEGILVRRNGSGTYVRKVASAPEGPSFYGRVPLLDGETLFGRSEERQHRCAPLNKDRKFKIGTVFAGSSQSFSAVYQHIFDGLVARGREIGAYITPHPLVKLERTVDIKDRIRELLSEDGYDGLIVTSQDNVVLDVLSEQNHRPVVYLDFANRDWNLRADLHPMVSFDLRHAMIAALKILSAAGHRKIGVIGFHTGQSIGDVDRDEDRLLYEHIMGRLGLSYNQALFLGINNAQNRVALKRFLRGPDAPTAVYFCDDVALMRALPFLRELGCEPGKNLAVISHSNKGVPLPSGAGVEWSRMEFAPLQVATLTLDVIVAEMKSALPDIVSLAHRPTWIPGTSHLFTGKLED